MSTIAHSSARGCPRVHPQVVRMSEPRWPVFLLDGADVTAVTDPSDARHKVEPSLSARPVEFYDSLARTVRIVVDAGQRARHFFRSRQRQDVRLEVISQVQHEERLRVALTTYLRSTGRAIPDQRDPVIFACAVAELIR